MRSERCAVQNQAITLSLTNVLIHFRMTKLKGFVKQMHINRKLLSWDHQNYSFPVVTRMGSMFGHRIDYNGVGVLRGQRHDPAKINPSICLSF